ncbi:MAG: FAD-dependent oxidoreductase [Patescibacteria group bacterium]
MKNQKPKIAVIGGGIFGTTCALILGKQYPVTLFERHSDILCEASRKNQYRHHAGFHYPRSPEMIREIKSAAKDFTSFYKNAIIYDFPSFYCVAKDGSKISAKDFLRNCKKLKIWHKKEYPPDEFLNPDEVDVCVRTREAVYDYDKLKRFISNKIKKNRNINLKLNHRVFGARFLKNGKKIIIIGSGKKKKQKEVFDYIINATYANYNQFCDWLGFTKKKLEYRLKEIIVVRLNIKKGYAITVVDGPFATLIPTVLKNIFTFGDVPLSVRKTYTQKNPVRLSLMEKKLEKFESLWPEMQARCAKWIPIIRDAKYLESMFVILPVDLSAKSTDIRPTDVVNHGRGCFSILSGKIITCVSAAKNISKEIQSSWTPYKK